MPNRQYSWTVLAVPNALFLVAQIATCQAATFTLKGFLEFRIDIHKLDLTNSSNYVHTFLLGDNSTTVKNTSTHWLALEDAALRIRERDGLCQSFYTLTGDPQLVSVLLVVWAHLTIYMEGETVNFTVAFESKGRRYRVSTDEACDVRRVIQPCDQTEECSLGGCIPKQPEQITTGNLIVLGYAGAFILFLVLVILFCFYRVASLKNRRNKGKNTTAPASNSVEIQNRTYWGNV
ncbi:hypothetical protein BsWGS_25574 [Bradybaena similaris]